MKTVYDHLRINANLAKASKLIEDFNFLVRREIHKVVMHGGATVKLGVKVKDELIFFKEMTTLWMVFKSPREHSAWLTNDLFAEVKLEVRDSRNNEHLLRPYPSS